MFSGVKLNKARRDHEHEDREAVLPGALKGYVYRPQGWLSPVVLVDGRMEGVWRHERRGDRLSVEIEPFAHQPDWVRRAEEEAERLARFVGGELELSGRTREEERQSPAGAEEPRTGLVPASERRTNPAVFAASGSATIDGRHCTLKKRNAMAERPDAANPATGSVRYVDPEGLNKNPAFTNVVVVEGPARTVYVGGQDSVDASGNIVGKGDLAAQTEQVLANVRAALAAGGAGPEHVIKWNLLVVEGLSLQEGFSAFQRAWVATPNPPAITMAYVAGLANPEFLVEMDAIAVVPL
jgi:enamine deaminase RidA (YjgF/YER057c/UK114 family)